MYKAIKGKGITYASPQRVQELYKQGYVIYDENENKLTEEEVLKIKPETHTLDLRRYQQ